MAACLSVARDVEQSFSECVANLLKDLILLNKHSIRLRPTWYLAKAVALCAVRAIQDLRGRAPVFDLTTDPTAVASLVARNDLAA